VNSDEDDSVPISETENEETLPCGFRGVKYFGENSVLKGEWIGYRRCKTWCCEVCVGGRGKKKLYVENVCQERLIRISP
jgi:hypothetical protein